MIIYTQILKDFNQKIGDEEEEELNYKKEEYYEETYYERNYLVAGYTGCKNTDSTIDSSQEK
ncbi:MAG: hypothetical protein HQ554_04275 [FCB group bacterium]|nr:hypothetical protein [FCB group bacterium]